MKREFQNILDHDKAEHPVIFVPPNFIFNEFTEKVRQKLIQSIQSSGKSKIDLAFLFSMQFIIMPT
jgi:hypothetical protein